MDAAASDGENGNRRERSVGRVTKGPETLGPFTRVHDVESRLFRDGRREAAVHRQPVELIAVVSDLPAQLNLQRDLQRYSSTVSITWYLLIVVL